jgi:hypothetical protein
MRKHTLGLRVIEEFRGLIDHPYLVWRRLEETSNWIGTLFLTVAIDAVPLMFHK